MYFPLMNGTDMVGNLGFGVVIALVLYALSTKGKITFLDLSLLQMTTVFPDLFVNNPLISALFSIAALVTSSILALLSSSFSAFSGFAITMSDGLSVVGIGISLSATAA